MKKKIFVLAFTATIICTAFNANAQKSMENFFRADRTAHDLSSFAHLTNTLQGGGTYDLEPGYVIVGINSYDNFWGHTVFTKIEIDRGLGDLYFNNIKALQDTDGFPAFDAFGATAAILAELAKEVNPQQYNEIKQKMIQLLGTNPENWNGEGWALFALNLDYAAYYFSNDY